MIEQWPILSMLIWLPILSGGAIFLLGGDKQPNMARWVALGASLVALILCIPLWQHFDSSTSQFQFVERVEWLGAIKAQYALGIDGFALPLIVLTCFLTVLVVLASWRSIQNRVAHYMAAFLIMEGVMNGVFMALDALLFYVFWEAMLIPMFLIIGIWGGQNRVYATIKFFLYTFLGSVFLLVCLIYLRVKASSMGLEPSFAIETFSQLPLGIDAQKWIFIGFLLAFAVKIPMWPVHTWLPDAHVEAPTAGSVILAAIMLKMGGYGFIRFSLPIVPDACRFFEPLMITLSLMAVVYIGFVAIVQKDMKKLIAYSSIAHMGFVTLGVFILFSLIDKLDGFDVAAMGVEGAYIQMISHGFISGALFLCVGVLYDRMHSRKISDYGGVANVMPMFAFFFVLFAMANAGLPGTSGFVGEFLVILSSFQVSFWYAFLAATTLILGAAYTLWMVKRVLFGQVANEGVAALSDIGGREMFVLGCLAFLVLLFGIWPAPLIDVTHASVVDLLNHVAKTKF